MSRKGAPIPPPPGRGEQFEVVLSREGASIATALPHDYYRLAVVAENTIRARLIAEEAIPGWRAIACVRPGEQTPEELEARRRQVEALVDPRERLDPRERVLPSWPV
jgi:hypothetical protein